MSKHVNTRIQNKIDTSANWDKATNFTPLKGEIIIYSDLKKIKIGDGTTKVGALQFLADDDTNTHYTTGAYVGAANTKSNASTTNGHTYLKVYDDDTKRAEFKISGSGATSVTSDANGNITISSTDTNTHQSIKTLKTDNTTAQATSASEAIAGSGTINLHKVSKTGSYNDLLNKPEIQDKILWKIDNEALLRSKDAWIYKLEQTLTEIKEIAEAESYLSPKTTRLLVHKILQKISECEVEDD